MHTNPFEASNQTLPVDKKLNILAVGAHPDDIELGCGGFLLRNATHNVSIVCVTMTRGGASGDKEQRYFECLKAAQLIHPHKCSPIVLDYPDANLELKKNIIDEIEGIIKVHKPDIIFTHVPTDVHHDHRIVAEATFEAGRNCPNILCYEDIVTKNFTPHIYYDITSVIDLKIQLVSVFKTQAHKFFMQSNTIKGLAQYRAMQCRPQRENINMMEAYHIHKLSMCEDLQMVTYVS